MEPIIQLTASVSIRYKAKGHSYIDKSGTPDCNEFYIMSKDDFLGVAEPIAHPHLIEAQRSLIADFANQAHDICMVILGSLSASLGLQPTEVGHTCPADVLTSIHCKHRPSQDSVTFIKYPYLDPAPATQPLASHTDYGSITLIVPDSVGLQLLVSSPEGETWQDVHPKQGHVVVNCGDALSLLTNDAIRSNIHRVASQVERNSTAPRYTLGYFARPLNDIRLRPLIPTSARESAIEDDDSAPTTKEWVSRRYQTRLVHRYQGEEAWDTTTGTEKQARSNLKTRAFEEEES